MSARIGSVIRSSASLLAVLLACAFPVTLAAQDTTASSMPERPVGVLRPGDLLKVVVFEPNELSGEFMIDSRGFVQIPGVGEVRAAGLDPSSMRTLLIRELERTGIRSPSLSVQPLIRINVLGEVLNPGLQPVEPGITLLSLLSLVGGTTDRADLEKAYVIREGQRYSVDLERALAGDVTGSIPLYSNDVLVIPRKGGLTRENLSFFMTAASMALAVANVLLSAR